MYDQPPFPANRSGGERAGKADELGVIVPTRNRPDRLARCLAALAEARDEAPFRAYVCDSSAAEAAGAVAEVCAGHEFVELVRHDRDGAAAARNVGTRACPSPLIVTIDDDVYVDPDSIAALRDAHRRRPGAVVAGSVTWSFWSSRPLVMRPIGVGREARDGEEPEFFVSAMLLYPRDLALRFPWNERLWPFDDRYVSLVWRAAGAPLVFEPAATATHDPIHNDYPLEHEADRIYVNALDAFFVSRSPRKMLQYELLYFAAATKKWARSPRTVRTLLRAWTRGHRALLRDRRELRETVREALTEAAAPRS